MKFNNLLQWLEWLEGLHPSAICLGLDRIAAVATRLGIFERIAQQKPRVITIAGTNGKGSCVATLEALLLAQNLTCGCYTSPHFLRYNERIRVNGIEAADADIVTAFAAIEAVRGETSLTYFEYGTLAALWIFLERRVDYVVLEVGLGGRLDAVNIIDADVAIVTSVDLDHQEWLGNSREQIAREKAGVYRQGKFALCADAAPPQSLLETAASVGANLLCVGRDYGWTLTPGDRNEMELQLQRHLQLQSGDKLHDQRKYLTLPVPSLPIPSVVSALQALELLAVLPEQHIVAAAIGRLALTGRMQQLGVGDKNLLLDVAHNPAAAVYLAKKLAPQAPLRAVFAVMADKDYPAILSAMQNTVSEWYLAALADNPRAATLADLKRAATELGLVARSCDTVAVALSQALQDAAPGETVLVFGSFYTIAAALSDSELIAHSSQ